MTPPAKTNKTGVMLPLPISLTEDGAYDYRVPAGLSLSPGDFVAVPFGPRRVIGVVWGEADAERCLHAGRRKGVECGWGLTKIAEYL